MKTARLPEYFSTLKKGKITLFINKKYEVKLTEQDFNVFFGLYNETSSRSVHIQKERLPDGMSVDPYTGETEFRVSYHGRTPCKSIFVKNLDNGNLVVRDYWHGGLFGNVLKDIFWQGFRPIKELLICEGACKKGIRTIEIIAIVKNRVLGPFYRSKLISREIRDSVDLMEFLLRVDNQTILAKKKEIISKVAQAIKIMHDAGIYHADLNLKNILLQKPNRGEFVVYIIDLDKSREFKELNLQRRMKNLMRLDRSLEKFKRNVSMKNCFHVSCSSFFTQKDKIRFFKEYLRSGRYLTPPKLIRSDSEEMFRHEAALNSYGKMKKYLQVFLEMYPWNHKKHRFWWFLTDLSRKK